MFRKSIAFLLLLVFAAMSFSRGIILTSFLAKQEFIAKNLCENRDRPQMKCCGRCLLKKKLKTEDSRDQENPERKVEKNPEILSAISNYCLPSLTNRFLNVSYSDLQEKLETQSPSGFFHPPQV